MGKPVQVFQAPLEAVVPTFTWLGASQNIAELLREKYEGMANDRIAAGTGERVRGTTSLETTLRALLA